MGKENLDAKNTGRAKELSNAIGSYHVDLNMETVVLRFNPSLPSLQQNPPSKSTGFQAENLALQNIQVWLCHGECLMLLLGAVTNGLGLFYLRSSFHGSEVEEEVARTWLFNVDEP
jgi:hypothetical protein